MRTPLRLPTVRVFHLTAVATLLLSPSVYLRAQDVPDNPADGELSKIKDSDFVFDQLAKGPPLPPLLLTGSDFRHQPGVRLQPAMVKFWEDQHAADDKVDPRVQRLIELGQPATARVHQQLKTMVATDRLAPHLSIVLRSTGTAESIPLLIKLLARTPEGVDPPWLSVRADTTEFAVTSALWKLTGRKHVFTVHEWEKWWQSVEPGFVVQRDRGRPEFQARVTADRVKGLVKELATNEEAARERLIALGPAALPHLLAAISTEIPRPRDNDSHASAVKGSSQSVRLAWVIDELGATDKLPVDLRRKYFTQRFSDTGGSLLARPIEEDAACRALSHCSFADFCTILLAAERASSREYAVRDWVVLNSYVFRRRLAADPLVGPGDPSGMPLWNQITPATSPNAEVASAAAAIIQGLEDKKHAGVRACAAALANVVGFCSAAQPEPLIVALRDGWLIESESNLRLDIGLAMARFSSPLVLEAVSQGLKSDRSEIVSDAAALVGSAKFGASDKTRSVFERLVELTYHENDLLRKRAVSSLRARAPSLLVAEFERLVTDSDEDIRKECAFALREKPNPKFADALFKLADDPSEQVRIEALSTIGQLKHPASMKRLLPFLRDKRVQGSAVAALANLGGKDALPLLMSELEAGNDVDGAMYQHLRRLTGNVFGDRPEPWLKWWAQKSACDAP